ncbi:MAG: ImmA/IrrE family metallo-endopeptidase [Fusobacteriaceae bacterium]
MYKDFTLLKSMSIKEILNYLKIEVLYTNTIFPNISTAIDKKEKLASIQIFMNRIFIYLDNILLDEENKLLHDFILCHEIGHIINEHFDYTPILNFLATTNKSTFYIHAKTEHEANHFALEYIMYRENTTKFNIKQFLLESYNIKL